MGQSVPLRINISKASKKLSEAVSGTQREVVQLERGRVRGRLAHLSIDDLPIDIETFSVGVRSRGVPSNRVLIGILTGCTGRTTQWSHETHHGDVIAMPPGAEHDARYYGGASFAVITLSPAEIYSFFSGDARLQDIEFWQRKIVSPASGAKEHLRV